MRVPGYMCIVTYIHIYMADVMAGFLGIGLDRIYSECVGVVIVSKAYQQ